MSQAAALLRHLDDKTRPYRPTAIAFVVAALSLIVAGIYLFSPGLAETTAPTTVWRGLTRALVVAFGPATLLLALLAGAHAVLFLLDRGIDFTPQRIAAATGLAVFLPCLFALAGGDHGAAGGVIGLLARDAVLFFSPPLFAFSLMTGLTLLSLVFCTDWMFANAMQRAPAKRKRRRRAKPKARKRMRRAPAPAPDPEPEPVGEDEEAEAGDGDAFEEDEEELAEDEEFEEEEGDVEEAEEDDYEHEHEWEEEDAEEEPEPEPEPEPARKPAPAPPSPPPASRPKSGKHPIPAPSLLTADQPIDLGRLEKAIQANAQILERSLASFRIETRVVGHTRGPVITMYELALKEGTKLSQIVNRADDLAIALKAESVRIVAPIPGKSTVGVEVPNSIRDEVGLRALIEECSARARRMSIPLFLGRDAAGRPMLEDLARMPHLLIAGATGSGKSVCINSIILSILMSRTMEEVRLILVDPKQVELAFFREIPHLLTSVVTDPRKAAQTLDWVVTEMEDRYRIFAMFGVRNIDAYNKLGKKRIAELAEKHDVAEENAPAHMPHLVVVVDELADLLMTGKKDVEQAVTRLAQKSRAVGIHTVLATQRPSTDVITGLIKANMPSRASFKVTSKVDSRVVLDQGGAEKLLGMGDMLFLPPRSFHLVRAQGCFVSDDEVRGVVDFLRENGPGQQLRELIVKAETIDDRDPREIDALFEQACRVVLETRRGSASLLQRRLQIGYTRASRLIDLMRAQGIIGEFKNSQAADVLMTAEDFEDKFGGPRA